jgi:hypothetical protein
MLNVLTEGAVVQQLSDDPALSLLGHRRSKMDPEGYG